LVNVEPYQLGEKWVTDVLMLRMAKFDTVLRTTGKNPALGQQQSTYALWEQNSNGEKELVTILKGMEEGTAG
jgi:hypothetical protein